jgi:hypothetical protein
MSILFWYFPYIIYCGVCDVIFSTPTISADIQESRRSTEREQSAPVTEPK